MSSRNLTTFSLAVDEFKELNACQEDELKLIVCAADEYILKRET